MKRVVASFPGPVRFKFRELTVDSTVLATNVVYAESLGIPVIQRTPAHKRKLAVCGSGPSLERHIKDLRHWDGDIWAINFAQEYLFTKGIQATLFVTDPRPFDVARFRRAKAAIVAASCHPAVFDSLLGRLRMFYLAPPVPKGAFVVTGGTTAATRTPTLALEMGYRDATFFGCEGSFEEQSHIDRHEEFVDLLHVAAGGNIYRTFPEWIMQSEWLAGVLRTAPQAFKERSGGLLRAIGRHKDWTTVAVSDTFRLDQVAA